VLVDPACRWVKETGPRAARGAADLDDLPTVGALETGYWVLPVCTGKPRPRGVAQMRSGSNVPRLSD
jgi:hypothetical protein